MEENCEKNHFIAFISQNELQILFLMPTDNLKGTSLDILTITAANWGSLDIACIGECQSLSVIYVNPKRRAIINDLTEALWLGPNNGGEL